MSAQSISRFPVPTLAELPADIRARIEEVQQKAGFIPNVFITLAHRPDEFRAFFAYHDALLLKEGGLSKAEREMIIVATSAANQCHYCVIAHGAILRRRGEFLLGLCRPALELGLGQSLDGDRHVGVINATDLVALAVVDAGQIGRAHV